MKHGPERRRESKGKGKGSPSSNSMGKGSPKGTNSSGKGTPPTQNVLVEKPVVEPKENTPDDMRVRSEKRVNQSSTYRRVVQKRQNTSKPTGRHNVFITHFQKIPLGPELRRFDDAFTADHEVLAEENECRLLHRYAVVVQDGQVDGISKTDSS